MLPDGALNRVKHTLLCVKFLNARQSSDSWAQEREGHALSTKTFRSHVTRDYTVLTRSGKPNNGLNCYWPCPHALNHVIPHKCDLTII